MSQENRRFTGTRTLYGADRLDAFTKTHAYIIGVGGVGSWVAEALARTGIGHIYLIDLDIIVESNVNRQLPALSTNFGVSKIEAMGERLRQINPDCHIHQIDDFLSKDNVQSLLPSRAQQNILKAQGESILILDCCDDLQAKLAIALHCRFNKLKLVVAGAAGGKIDPSQLKVADLKDTYQDALLAKLRDKLKALGINRELKEKFAIKCIFSSERAKLTTSCDGSLNCGGYGSSMMVTCAMAMLMVSTGLAMIA